MKAPIPTVADYQRVFGPIHQQINLKTAKGFDDMVDIFLKAFEQRYTEEEFDLGLQDQHFRHCYDWFVFTYR